MVMNEDLSSYLLTFSDFRNSPVFSFGTFLFLCSCLPQKIQENQLLTDPRGNSREENKIDDGKRREIREQRKEKRRD